MKTKTFLLICLLSGIGLTQLYAQGNEKSSDTRSISHRTQGPFWFPVYCDGVLIDYLTATVDAHYIEHYKDGVSVWLIGHVKDEFYSTSRDEFFKVLEIDKLFIPDPSIWVWAQTNLIGDKGSHYIAEQTWYPDGTFTIDKALCIENGRK